MYVQISDSAPVNRHKPSVDYLFQSAQKLDRVDLVAALLTGMGADGARGLKALRDRGARTIAQNEATCVVYGMPREAVALGAAEFILSIDEIAEALLKLSTTTASKPRSA